MRASTRVVLAVAVVARAAVVGWGWGRFPAVEDGHYYDYYAARLAHGGGYTWVWPDGTATYAAHYPVGYPALLAPLYALFGASANVAALFNAALGVVATFALLRLLERAASERAATVGACVYAVHPALLFYVPAVMTEGITASLLVVAAWLAAEARTSKHARRWRVACGIMMGVATLVRPQSVVLAPILGLLSTDGAWRARLLAAAGVGALAIACCLPWTARNCVRMNRCALVSVNGGWNLLIGEGSTEGGWSKVDVPPECATVWDEAGKDVCFGRAAERAIWGAPLHWIAEMPAKVAMTFDYLGAAPWYLNVSNPNVVDGKGKIALAAVETVVTRALLLVALVRIGLLEGERRRSRILLCALGAAATLTLYAWVGYLLLATAIAMLGRRLAEAPLLLPFGAAVVVVTAATHAVFFGAGRYGLVVVPFVTALAFVGSRGSFGRVAAVQAIAGSQEREESPSSKEHDPGNAR